MSEPIQAVISFNDCIPFGTSLFGAFFGALGAYWVGRFKEKRDEIKRRHSALLATQYALFSQWHVIENLRRFLDPQREHEHRHVRLGKYVSADAELVPFAELTFIIDSKTPNLLQEIHLTQMAYLQTMKILGRYDSMKEEFELKHPPVDLNPETNMSKISVSKDEYHRMRIVVDFLYKTVDETLPKFNEQIADIHRFVKCNLRGRKAIPGIPSEAASIARAQDKQS